MSVAVSSSGPALDAQVDPRFGRCPHFLIVDPVSLGFESIENSSVVAAQGAGIATAQMIVDKGVEAVLTGNCGPNAYQVLSAAGVKVITGVSGTVREAVAAYAGGAYQASDQPNVASHFGMGAGAGKGMGGGVRMAPPALRPTAQGPVADDLPVLLREMKAQLDVLRQQVDDIRNRIDELHKDS
jgi:predicted Fe-Mo cluster-binding NifX family protein